jgi:hypothetical protein
MTRALAAGKLPATQVWGVWYTPRCDPLRIGTVTSDMTAKVFIVGRN